MEALSGRVWKFGSDINTDLIMPGPAMFVSPKEQPKFCMKPNRPGWADQVQPGDVLIAARNFGTGSGRPGARVLRDLGIAVLIAESINGLFFRNCVNYRLPALEVPGIDAAFEEGDTAEIDFDSFSVRNVRTGDVSHAAPWPDLLANIYAAGGIFSLLERDGYIRGQI